MRLKLIYILLCFLLAFQNAAHAEEINIWQGTTCKKKVELIPYLAPGFHNKAVIVCPGGSYLWHDMEAEGHTVGKWLQANGISAFVLHYRTAGFMAFFWHYRYIFRGVRYPDALNDLYRATLYIKEHAQELGINPDSVGAMGFSAGGHLVMSGGENFYGAANKHLLNALSSHLPQNNQRGNQTLMTDAQIRELKQKLRLAFIAPIYPVVTMAEPCVHKRSRRALMGDNRNHNKAFRDSLSLERHVPDDCPPVFLVNCKDDPIVKYHNSELLDSALTAHGIPHRYIQYQTGGHGFGASDEKGTEECRQWKGEFLEWLRKLK